MADRLKGITIQVDGETTGLKKALAGVNSDLRTTQAQLNDVNRLLKLDPKNTQLLEQKQRLLGKAIDETNDKLKSLRDAEKQVAEQVKQDKAPIEQQEALQREIIATEKALNKLEQQQKELNAQMEQAPTKLDLFGDKMQGVADKAGLVADKTRAASMAAGGFLVALGALGIKSAATADELNTLAKQTGFSTEELQKMSYASDLIDVSMDDITGAIKRLKKNLTSSSVDWESLGVSIYGANGELRDATDIFYDTVSALGNIENETERDTKAMEVFGKSADSLAGIIDDGGQALRDYGEEAENLGLIIDQKTLDEMNALNDEFDKIKNRAKMEALKLGAKALKALEPAIKAIVEKLHGLFDWLSKLDDKQMRLLVTIAAVVAAISPVARIVQGISTLVGTFATQVIPKLSSALTFLAAHPVVATVVAITALITAFVALGKAVYDQAKSYSTLTEEEKKLVSEAKEAADAFREQQETFAKTAEGTQAQFAYTQKLADELKTLADESGNVADKDKARAQFILGELNSALGTEYTMTGNQIAQYEKLTDSIDKLIEKKKAEVLLSAYEEEYSTAIKERAKNYKAIDKAAKDYADTQKILNNLPSEADSNVRLAFANAAKEKKQIWQDLKKADADYTDTITRYEAAMVANIEGNTALIEDILTGQVELYEDKNGEMVQAAKDTAPKMNEAGKQIPKAEADGINANSQKPVEATKNIANQLPGAASSKNGEIRQAGQGISSALGSGITGGSGAAKGAYGRMISSIANRGISAAEMGALILTGKQMGEGIDRGLSQKMRETAKKVTRLILDLIAKMNKAAQVNSPSKLTMKTGEALGEGLGLGIDKSTGFAVKQAERQANAVLGAYGGKTGLSATGASKTTNVGGVSVNVYAQQGQNANAIADMVMKRFNIALNNAEVLGR